MSLSHDEHFPVMIPMHVTCQICGKEEVKNYLESTPIIVLEHNLCDDCENNKLDDHLTMEKYNDLVQSNYGVRLNPNELVDAWDDYTQRNLNGKAIISYDHIAQLNLNDRKG